MEELNAKELLTRLKVKTLLDLALILPKSYDDNRLSETIEIGEQITVQAVVKSTYSSSQGFRVLFYLPKFKKSIYGVFFRASTYHYQTFKVCSSHIIQGKISLFHEKWQIIQPKSIKSYGDIIPKYKTPLKESIFRVLIRQFVTKNALEREGLTPKEVETILRLHFPKQFKWQNPTTKYSDDAVFILKMVEAFNHIKKMTKKRRFYQAKNALKGDVESFVNSLPFRLTSDQKKVIEEIKNDLARDEIATRRVVIGDVGSGKSIVILASAVIARENGAVLMAPTSILAHQLYEDAKRFLPKDMKIALLTQSKSEGDFQSADFIVGTHSLLYAKNLPQVSLVMVDEQHRFGSNQRAKLETLFEEDGKRPHFLQFSATPIPRTQAMMQSALVDVSIIEQTPFQKSIITKIIGKRDFPNLLKKIEEEISKNHQILIIYPLVEESGSVPYFSIDEARYFWESRYDGVYVTHGKDKNKDQVLEEFRDNGKILLATTVIEVGISLPRLTLIVIVGAERLGLASLHQLRGRVGRNGLPSWCYLYTNLSSPPQRLKEFAKRDSGFEIARLDLIYRDSGDILDGTIQSGQKFKWLNLATDDDVIKKAKYRVSQLKESNS